VPGGGAAQSVPTIVVQDALQIAQLRQRGLLSPTDADAIGDKLAHDETLSFEDAKRLLDALNAFMGTGSPKERAQARETRLKWARFLEANKDKISGTGRAAEHGKSIDDVQSVIDTQKEFVAVHGTQGGDQSEDVMDPETRKSWNSLADWEKGLLTEYASKYGAGKSDMAKDLRITHTDLMRMALQISPKYMRGGARQAILDMLNDDKFWAVAFVGIVLYMASIVLPEPLISKATAASITAALLILFTLSEIKNLAVAWMTLSDEVEFARDLATVEAAAEHFGKAVGGVLGRVLVTLAMILLGKAIESTAGSVGGGGTATAEAVTPEGIRIQMPVPQAAVVAVPAPGVAGVAVMGPPTENSLMAAMQGQGGGGGGGGKEGPPKPPEGGEAATDYKSMKPEDLQQRIQNGDTDAALELASRTKAGGAQGGGWAQNVAAGGKALPNERVWVNTKSGIYHRAGSEFFGPTNTQEGEWMTAKDADAAGYRQAKDAPGLEAARRGTAENTMVKNAMRPFEGKSFGDWRLEAVERTVGGTKRVDELYINDADKRIFVWDTFTGEVEPPSHFEKGWEYSWESKIRDLISKGYRYDYSVAIKHPAMLQ